MHDDTAHTEIIALALGSNLGDRVGALRSAIAKLGRFITVLDKSAIYETPPAYVTDQPAFLNAALTCTTKLEPLDLLHTVKSVETELGREKSVRYGPRLIDIDLIFYGSRQMEMLNLSLPHPRMAEREFVLRPLADIAGNWKHPVTQITVSEMLVGLPEFTAKKIAESL